MSPRQALALAALSAALIPAPLSAQQAAADKLRESKLEIYLARAQAAVDRLDDELSDRHIDGARVAARELRQALAELEKARRSSVRRHGHGPSTGPVTPVQHGAAPAPEAPALFEALRLQSEASSGPKPTPEPARGENQIPLLFELLNPAGQDGQHPAPEGANAARQLLPERGADDRARTSAEEPDGEPNAKPEAQTPQSPAQPDTRPTSTTKKRDIMADSADPAGYRELQLGSKTVIVPESLLGARGEVIERDGSLVIRKDPR